jgi:outer membrane protein assembly factor BamA
MNILRFFAPAFLWAGICLVAPTVAAQVYTAGRTEFVNPGPYSHEQLEAAAAIHPGTKFTADDLSASAQRLVDTGYFDDVMASLEGKYAAMTVTYQLKPTPKAAMLHVGFENFVWLTHAEIDAAIKAKSPMFEGYLPEGSANQDLLKTALTEALAAKGLRAEVVYETVEPTLAHPVREIEFRVKTPLVQVKDVKLAGVEPELVPYVQKSVSNAARKSYMEEPSGISTADQVLAPFKDAGYIRASLSRLEVTHEATSDGGAGVVLSATLEPGDVYKVGTISYKGMPLLSPDEFASKAKLHAGDVASRQALLDTLQPLDTVYRRQGYMDVTVVATPTLHNEMHQVDYAVAVNPGEPYHLQEVSLVNLDATGKAAFDTKFKMKAGEVFDPVYLSEFMRDNRGTPEFGHYDANYTAYAHPRTHTVDLVIAFSPR